MDKLLEDHINSIKNGSNEALLRNCEALIHEKNRKIAAADRHRKEQLKAINIMFEYEVEDAEALYNRAYTMLQDELIIEANSERMKQKMLAKHHLQKNQQPPHHAPSTTTSTTTGSTTTTAVTDNLLVAAPSSVVEEEGCRSSSQQSSSTTGRSLRSIVPTDYAEMISGHYQKETTSGLVTNGPTTTTTTTPAPVTGHSILAAMQAHRRKATAAAAASQSQLSSSSSSGLSSPTLEQSLPDNLMRADFLEIVRDLQMRAAAFEKTKSQALTEEVRVSGDFSELYIGRIIYSLGDLVVIFSVLSQENISGVITSLTHRDVVVRTGGGSRFLVLVGQIRSGRVTISKDHDMIENARIIRAAVDMAAVRDKIFN